MESTAAKTNAIGCILSISLAHTKTAETKMSIKTNFKNGIAIVPKTLLI